MSWELYRIKDIYKIGTFFGKLSCTGFSDTSRRASAVGLIHDFEKRGYDLEGWKTYMNTFFPFKRG
jgi:hypothetical protein